MNKLLISTALALTCWAGTAPAQDAERSAVVELFTSQGCSSCPPADAVLAMLAERPDVIALALHVDYWDYLGWADAFARPEHSVRQRLYAHAAGESTIYTPQMVINGTWSMVGADPEALGYMVMPAGGAEGPVLALERKLDRLAIRTTGGKVPAGQYEVELVRYLPQAKVSIERGENAGQMIDYTNIVTDWQTVGAWDGTAPLALDVPVQGDEPLVVLIQAADLGAIVAAARLR